MPNDLTKHSSLRISRRGLLLAALAAAPLVAIYGRLNYRRDLVVTELSIGLPATVAFLPDLHLHSREDAEPTIERLTEIQPDVILIGGDLVDEETPTIEVVDYLLEHVDSKERFAVLGNHEYWSGMAELCVSYLRRWGFTVLRDQTVESMVGKVFGIDWRDSRVYSSVEAEGLVIAHDPNVADYVRGDCFILAGHTHGGISIGGMLLYSNSKYSRGFYEIGPNVKMYVSRGIGNMSLQPRIESPPELLVLR